MREQQELEQNANLQSTSVELFFAVYTKNSRLIQGFSQRVKFLIFPRLSIVGDTVSFGIYSNNGMAQDKSLKHQVSQRQNKIHKVVENTSQ